MNGKKIQHNEIREGMLIQFANRPEARAWVVLNVTQQHIDEGLNAIALGLCAFAGMWYGIDPLDLNSYGKIAEIDKADSIYLIKENIGNLSHAAIRAMVD